ncbi:MAG: imidazolonepropionase [Actinomycetota bacterium]
MDEPHVINDGVVAWDGETIVYAGPGDGFDGSLDETYEGCTIVPGFVDCHTHLPFFGWREDEWEARLAGQTYRDLQGRGGGIARSARMLAEASDDMVLDFCRPLMAEMLAHGTTALEMKTGYGLSVDAELRQARLARALADEAPQTCTVTLLACHAVPEGVSREEWVRVACEELIPKALAEGFIDAVDVYVEDIAFSVADLERVAESASEAGLPLRCHAEQLGRTGSAEAASKLGARSADHLNNVDASGIAALAASHTVGVLLPASTFSLRMRPPPVAELIEAGVHLAVGTDFNPGTSPVLSMPEAIAMACSLYGLGPKQALTGATINGAWVLGLHDRLGSLEPGKRADFLVLDGEDVRMLAYRPGHNPVRRVFVGGKAA